MHPIGCLLVLDFRYRVPEWTSSSLWTVVPSVDRGPSSCPPDGLGFLVIGVLRLVRGVCGLCVYMLGAGTYAGYPSSGMDCRRADVLRMNTTSNRIGVG